jgi:transcriptional regulator GlxA family with amidase domain|nr:DJ-1/PfpI family protein [uncultured Undibacterium sp.]
MKIGIYIYDDAEVLDFAGPYEVFSTATRISYSDPKFQVFLIGETGQMVTARAGFRVHPDYGFHNCPNLDVLIVAGGVHDNEMMKASVIAWLAQQSSKAKLVASVCTGVFLLAQAGVVDGCEVTTHWQDVADLRTRFPKLTVVENRRWIDQGQVLTSGGISAGIDMSLHMLGRLSRLDVAKATAKQMEFSWTANQG